MTQCHCVTQAALLQAMRVEGILLVFILVVQCGKLGSAHFGGGRIVKHKGVSYLEQGPVAFSARIPGTPEFTFSTLKNMPAGQWLGSS